MSNPAPAGSREVPPPVGTPVSVGVAEYTRLWTAGTTPADWRWGPQPYGGRWAGPAAGCACVITSRPASRGKLHVVREEPKNAVNSVQGVTAAKQL